MFNFSIVVCCLSVLLWTHFSAYVFFELAVYFLISSLVGLSDFLCIDMYINRQREGGGRLTLVTRRLRGPVIIGRRLKRLRRTVYQLFITEGQSVVIV